MSELLPLRGVIALLAGSLSISTTAAGQQLLPVPYPEMLGPNAQIGGGNAGFAAHQDSRTRSAIQSRGTATGTSIYCQRPTGGNIIGGARTASSAREAFIWKVALEARGRLWGAARRILRGAPSRRHTSGAPQDEGAGV